MRVTALRRETVNETPPAKDVTANVTGNVAATPLDSGAADANLEEKILCIWQKLITNQSLSPKQLPNQNQKKAQSSFKSVSLVLKATPKPMLKK